MEQAAGYPQQIPVLATPRLRLRGHRQEDLPAMVAMWRDPDVTRFLNTPPLNEEDTWGRLLRYAGHWSTLGYGYWAIEDRSTGAFIGEAGFANYHRSTEPAMHLAPEAGWVLARASHGQGYGTEVAQTILRWGREHFGAVPIRCIVHPEHAASLRIAARCGFQPVVTLQYRGSPAVLLELPGEPVT